MSIQSPYTHAIADLLNCRHQQVDNTLKLLGDGGTVPFIARYRKELTGSLDEVAIAAIRDHHQHLAEIDKRRHTIIETLGRLGLQTDDLMLQLQNAQTLAELEDLYLPFKPKRKTRGLIARERGLEPVAEMLLQGMQPLQLHLFHHPENGLANDEDVLAGARDIIAEKVSENQPTRAELRLLFQKEAIIESQVVKKNMAEGEKYTDYFDWREPAAKAPAHRLLAMFRGAREKFLTLSIRPPEESGLRLVKKDICQRARGRRKWQKPSRIAIKDFSPLPWKTNWQGI